MKIKKSNFDFLCTQLIGGKREEQGCKFTFSKFHIIFHSFFLSFIRETFELNPFTRHRIYAIFDSERKIWLVLHITRWDDWVWEIKEMNRERERERERERRERKRIEREERKN